MKKRPKLRLVGKPTGYDKALVAVQTARDNEEGIVVLRANGNFTETTIHSINIFSIAQGINHLFAQHPDIVKAMFLMQAMED